MPELIVHENPNLKYRWTDQEKRYLIDNYVRLTVREIAHTLGKESKEVIAVITRLHQQGDKELVRKKWCDKTRKCVAILSQATPTEIAYLAGLIDGEGTITVTKSQRNTLRPMVNLTNTNTLMIEWLGKFFWQKPTPIKSPRHWRAVYRVALVGYGITPFLQAIEPYLTAKKLNCQLVQEFIALRKLQRWKERPSPRMLEIKRDLNLLNSSKASDVTKLEVRQKYSIIALSKQSSKGGT